MKYFLLITILFFSCIEGNSTPVESIDSIPAPVCRHEALYLASWAEDYGFESTIVYGRQDNVAHAQAKYFDGTKWNWIGLKDGKPFIKQMQTWEQKEEYTTVEFLEKLHWWARSYDFYEVK